MVNDSVRPERRASCSCGQLSVVAKTDPLRVSACHCLACQRRTGSAFGVQARFPRNEVIVQGEASVFDRVGDSGGLVSFRFCAHCGATVYYTLEKYPDVIGVPVGAFADPTFPEPQMSFFESRRHAWVRLPTSAEIFDD